MLTISIGCQLLTHFDRLDLKLAFSHFSYAFIYQDSATDSFPTDYEQVHLCPQRLTKNVICKRMLKLTISDNSS
jgi:hypothetical protein